MSIKDQEEIKGMSDHDLLILLYERVENIRESLQTHLKHRWEIFLIILVVLLGIII